jgi:hypothetical protein
VGIEPLIARLVADAGPVGLVRSVRVRLAHWAAATLLFLVAMSLLLRMRPDLPAMLARPAFFWSAAALTLAAALAAAAALVLSVPGAARPIAHRAAPVLCAIAWPVLLLVSSAAGPSIAATPAGVCALLIATIAAGPAWLLHRYVREGASMAPAWSTGLTVLAAGCAAALAQQLHCATDDPTHLFSEHVLAVAVLAAGGAALAGVRRRRSARA